MKKKLLRSELPPLSFLRNRRHNVKLISPRKSVLQTHKLPLRSRDRSKLRQREKRKRLKNLKNSMRSEREWADT